MKKTKQVPLKLAEETHQRISAIAEREERDLQQQARIFLKAGLALYEASIAKKRTPQSLFRVIQIQLK